MVPVGETACRAGASEGGSASHGAISKSGESCSRQHWRKTSRMRNMCHETETQFRQQGSSDSCFSVRNFHQHCCARESPAWSPDCGKSTELRLEFGFPSPDRWQV